MLITVALFALPTAYAIPGGRRVLSRHRWPVLGVQAVLTWVPVTLSGGQWTVGLGGLLAGLVLLMVTAPVSWLLAGVLLAADVAVRAALTGLQLTPAWSGAVWAVVAFVDDGLWVFALVRLAQTVAEVDQARQKSAELAAAWERLQAIRALQSAVGERLAWIAATAAAARRSLSRDAAQARLLIGEAGAAAREAAARARLVADQPGPSRPELAGAASIRTRPAWIVPIVVLVAYNVQGVNNIVLDHDGLQRGVLLIASYLVVTALQLRHSRAVWRGARPRAWPLTLAVQAVLAYGFFLPPLTDFMSDAPFLAGSVLLLVPGRRRWAAYAAVVISWAALYAATPLRGYSAADRGAFMTVYEVPSSRSSACRCTGCRGWPRWPANLRGCGAN